jgi:hypothetical protein
MKECAFCQIFIEIPSSRRTTEDEGKRTINKRWCNKVRRYVAEEEEACVFFEIPKRFWCNRRQQWVVPIACINSQNKRREECRRCSQGSIVIEFMRRVPGKPRLFNSPMNNRPSLIRRNTDAEDILRKQGQGL